MARTHTAHRAAFKTGGALHAAARAPSGSLLGAGEWDGLCVRGQARALEWPPLRARVCVYVHTCMHADPPPQAAQGGGGAGAAAGTPAP